MEVVPSYRLLFPGYINNSGMKSHHKRDFQSILYLAGIYEQGCNLFFLVWSWELRLSVMSKANLPSYALTLPSLTPHRSVGTTSFLPLLYLNSPSLLVSSFQARNMLNIFYLEKEPTLTSTFSYPFFPSFHGKATWLFFIPIFTSSPPICYCTHDKRLSCYSSLRRVSCYEDFPHFSLYFFHLSF